MNIQLLKARQTKFAAYATVYTIVIIAVVVIANVLADRYDKSYDSTSNKRYSLSDQTAKIVKGLKQDVTITYLTRVPVSRTPRTYLKSTGASHPGFTSIYVDPDKKPQEAREAGIKNYGTAVVQIGANKEEAKSITEEGITGAFIRDLKHNTRTVCFLASSGEHQIGDPDRNGYSGSKDLAGQRQLRRESRWTCCRKPRSPPTAPCWRLAGPTRDYEQPEVDAIKKYVEDGGRALFMLDAPLKIGRAEIADNDALASVLQSWGVTLDKNLILDMNPIGQLAGRGSASSAGDQLHFAPYCDRNERLRDRVSTFALDGDQERRQDHRRKVVRFLQHQPGYQQPEFSVG